MGAGIRPDVGFIKKPCSCLHILLSVLPDGTRGLRSVAMTVPTADWINRNPIHESEFQIRSCDCSFKPTDKHDSSLGVQPRG